MKINLSLRQKTWIFIAIFLIMITLSMTLLIHFLYERYYVEQQVDLLTSRAELLEDLYYEQDDETFLSRVIWMNQCAEASVFFSDDINTFQTSNNMTGRPLLADDEMKEILKNETVIVIEKNIWDSHPIIGVANPIFSDGEIKGAVFVYRELTEFIEPFESIKYRLIATIALIAFFIIFTVKRIMNFITMPLENMKIISEKMAEGDFSQRIEVTSHDEIGSLSNSFNILASNLELEDTKRREFLSNVSHELRTPLSYIKGYSEAIRDDVVEPKKYIQIIYDEADRMQRLVNDLLDLAQLEGDSYPINLQPLPFAQVIEDVTERFEYAAKQKNITIMKDLDYDTIVLGDEDRLEQVFENLLDNALRYTEDGQITLSLKESEESIVFTIKDEGIGIPKEEIPKLQERFYRVDKGRSRKEGGTGIGLSIVGKIVEKHHAKLKLDSEVNVGTTVTIVFPKCHEDDFYK